MTNVRVRAVDAGTGIAVVGVTVAGGGVETIGRGVGVTDATGDGPVVAVGVTAGVLAVDASGEVVAGAAVAPAAVASGAANDGLDAA